MDRELRESVNFSEGDLFCKRLLLYSLFMSDSIYSIITNGIENSIELPQTTKLLNKLLHLRIIQPLSRSFTVDEFIVDRQKLYKYDKERYPFYYNDVIDFYYPNDFILVSGSTTEYIRRNLHESHRIQEKLPDLDNTARMLDYIVTKRLYHFDQTGLTINSFNTIFQELEKGGVSNNQKNILKQRMNRELISIYNRRYLDFSKANIIKNIPQLRVFDAMDIDSNYDYEIYDTILNPLFMRNSLDKIEEFLIEWKEQREFLSQIDFLYGIVTGLIEKYTKNNRNESYQITINRIVSLLKRKINDINFDRICLSRTDGFYLYLSTLQKKLCLPQQDGTFFIAQKGEKMRKVLLPVANNTEFEMVIHVAQTFGLDLQREVNGVNTYYKFKTRCCYGYIVKCEAGSIGAGSSALTLADAISHLEIDTIIFGGIAFGNYKKANDSLKTCDILVSRQLWSYEPGKESEVFIPRGDKVTATPWLLDRFQNSKLEWKDSDVHFGLIASGEKLVNAVEFSKRIMDVEPELIGGEMEGAGMLSVAQRYSISWILVKAISDWGLGKSDEFQKKAAENAFRYIFLTITDFLA